MVKRDAKSAIWIWVAISLMLPLPIHGEEHVLRLLIWEGYAPAAYVEAFEQEIEAKYGKKVQFEVEHVKGSDDFFNAARDKSADLITPSHHLIKDARFQFVAKKLILPIDVDNIPNHTNVIPPLQKADYHTDGGRIYGVPVAQGPYGIAYNIKKFEQAPESWNIFWEPENKHQYTIGAEEYLYNVNITALALGYPADAISNFDLLNNHQFKARLRQLALNAHSFWVGIDEADDLLGLRFAASWGDSLTALKRNGEIWKMATPKEGTPWWIDDYAITWALADKPFLRMVAQEWINKVLSSDFQIENILREISIYPVVTGLSEKLTAEENERLQTKSPETFMDGRILQHIYSQRDRNGLRLMWETAMKGISIEGNK